MPHPVALPPHLVASPHHHPLGLTLPFIEVSWRDLKICPIYFYPLFLPLTIIRTAMSNNDPLIYLPMALPSNNTAYII